jgi:hypothetical protein
MRRNLGNDLHGSQHSSRPVDVFAQTSSFYGFRAIARPDYRGVSRVGLTRKNSPTSAIVSPTTKVVPMTTRRNLFTGHGEEDVWIEIAGSPEKTVTSIPKKTQLIRRWGNLQCS